MSLVSYFPESLEPRPLQVKALASLEQALSGTKQNIVLRAPTGSGKSAIAATVARFFKSHNGTYVLCSRKYLQEQYLRDFSKLMVNFWGKSNYKCPVINASCSGCPADKSKSTADFSMFLRNNCTDSKLGDRCPYIVAKGKALAAPVALLNFEAFVANNIYGKEWPKRDVIIVDEAHNFTDRLAEQLAVPIPEAVRHTKDAQLMPSMLMYYDQAIERRKSLGQSYSKESLYLSLLEEYPKRDCWAREADYTLKLYKVSNSVKKYVNRMANKVIWMSASMTNGQCLEMGLTSKNSIIIDMPSEFRPSDHPIVCRGSVRIPKPRHILNAKEAVSQMRKVNSYILPIVERHSRGLIHTNSYALSKLLRDGSPELAAKKGVAFHTDSSDTDKLVKEFTEKKISWLVTPTLSEGFDGAGDLVQAQILLKTPWPSLASNKMKRLIEGTPFGRKLYTARAMSLFIQSYGRGARFKGDQCVTYLLDADFSRLLSGSWSDIPMWFRRVLEHNGFWEEG